MNNPDVRRADVDPLTHFIEHGWKEGRNPSQKFDTKYYLETYPDVQKAGVNPLIHYLRHGKKEGRFSSFEKERQNINLDKEVEKKEYDTNVKITDIMDLLLQEPQVPPVWIQQPIDILIPIYNGKEFLDSLFTSIVTNTYMPYRLLIANDKSTDLSISEYLSKFKIENPSIDITIIENEKNLGFVKTINKLTNFTQNHFVILNTDTEVPPHWLERLMYPILKNDNIASTTPFTNSGTICSFPNFLEDNPIFENMDVPSLDLFFQHVNLDKNLIEIPTAVGFCMGINKNVYKRIGMFDEIFGKGFGEENDWCMRALKLGYKSVIVPNLFVYHKHGGSFESEEKRNLMEVNSNLLKVKHPDYFPSVEKFIKKDPLRQLRYILAIKILSTLYKPKMILDHSIGGGANQYTKTIVSNEKISILVRYDISSTKYKITFCGQRVDEKSYNLEDIKDIERIIKFFNVAEIIVNELVSYPKVLDLIDFLENQKSNSQIDLTFMVHDYFCVCPMYNLLNYEIEYCGIPSDLKYCDKCIKINPLINNQIPFLREDYPNIGITFWRDRFSNLLEHCSKIVCFSQNSKTLLQRAFPNLSEDKFVITPHHVDWVRPIKSNKTSEVINIAVLGNMTIHKGANIVASLATYLDYHDLNIMIHIFGEIIEPFESFDMIKTVVKHNKYEKTDLPILMEKNEIDLVFIPSIWPETFSYTTEESMKMQIPVAVFDLGAPAERVKHYDKGIIFEKQNPEYIIKTIRKYLNKNVFVNPPTHQKIAFVCVSNNELIYSQSILSSAYMTEHDIYKFDNIKENIPIPIRYNDAIRQLLSSNYQGWVFFVHNDFSLLESADDIVKKLDKKNLYGPIGAIISENKKRTVGQILQGDKGRFIYFGNPIIAPTLVDTVDCQCLIINTDLLRNTGLRFDENKSLSFHQYVEEFCLNASINYGIRTYSVPLKCKHLSWGKVDQSLYQALNYIELKYPNKRWAGTCTHL